MGYLSSERPPDRWSPAYFRAFVEKLRTIINYLDASNFPNGLPMSTLVGIGSIPLNIDFFAVPVGVAITSITAINLGSSIVFNSKWASIADISFEVTAACVSGTITVGGVNGVMATVPITSATVTRYTAQLTNLPATTSTLVCKGTASTGNPLTILSARIIITLK